MSVAPFILSESWAVESAAAKHLLRKFFTTLPQTNAHLLLAEDRYMLQDTHNEKKFRFTLSDALHRAKANRAGVFDKLTFYVTPKVPVDIKLLKAVVTAGGGSVRRGPLSLSPSTHEFSSIRSWFKRLPHGF